MKSYKFKTKVTDMVGNTAESEELEITLDLIPGGSDNITKQQIQQQIQIKM